jgi:hypothetical protein
LSLIDSECLVDVERQRENHRREQSARIFLVNDNAMDLINTINKLRVEQQSLLFYTGGIDLLCQLIDNGQ